MLEQVKLALRISSTAFDAEIQQLIDDCLAEMRGLGITVVDAQTTTAVIAYCKSLFGNHPDADRWASVYQGKVAKLMSMSGYGLEDDR